MYIDAQQQQQPQLKEVQQAAQRGNRIVKMAYEPLFEINLNDKALFYLSVLAALVLLYKQEQTPVKRIDRTSKFQSISSENDWCEFPNDVKLIIELNPIYEESRKSDITKLERTGF